MSPKPAMMSQEETHDKKSTQDIITNEIDRKQAIEIARERQTDPLDGNIPRRLKFIVKETDDIFEVGVRLYMVIGRITNPRDRKIDIDLSPFANSHHGVSRFHSYIQVVDERISITDFNSTNGTYINGKLLQPTKPFRLRHGDNIRFGQLEVKVLFIGFEGNE